MLMALSHPQPAIPVKIDNSTAAIFVKDTLQNNRIKLWDVRYHWIIDQTSLDRFYVCWDRGIYNHADSPTKNHAPSHHRNIRLNYILKVFYVNSFF